MGNTVIRCVHGSTLREIKNGTYNAEKVGVYYGFENYKRTAQQILELINIIQDNQPSFCRLRR